MTVTERPTDQQLAGRGKHRREDPPVAPATARSRLPVSGVALSAATGVMVAAAAYSAGRLGHASSPWADRAYWLGQALIVVPAAARLLSRRALAAGETVALVLVLTVAEYLLKVCYSPTAFSFVDELEHWRSTVNLLQSGHLFTVNYLLPISPTYPGLEEVTSALVSVTGLSVYPAGLIVAGVAHLLFVCLLYVLFRYVSRSHRIAGVAVLFYSSNPDLPSFDSMFVYQTLAVAFLGLALLAAWRVVAPQAAGDRASWLVLAMLAIVATVVTHHVTSFILVAILAVASATSLVVGERRSAAWLAALSFASAIAVVCWVKFVAPGTVSYFQPTADGLLQSFRALLSGKTLHAPSTSAGPPGNQALGAVAVLTMSALLPAGWWQVWRHYRRRPWIVAMAIGSMSWYAVVVIRLVTVDGSELAGRAATFVFIPASLIAALAGARVISARFQHWRAAAVSATIFAGVLILLFDGLVNGWPPYWERLPGPHQVAGFERSVGPQEIAAGQWALAALGPGNRFAADFGNYPVLGSYGDQNPLRNVAYLYTSAEYTQADALLADAQELRYVLVDSRLSRSLPENGKYFPVDPGAGKYTSPLPLADLTKFNHVPGVARIYDGGNIVIYDLKGLGNAP
jgi:hypothetical protein